MPFKDELKKKTPKDPFDPKGLKKVLKNMSNEIVEIIKQVVESSSNKPCRPFKRNQPTNPQPSNTISNAENDDEDEDEASFSADKFQDEQNVELNRMWDFILPIFDSENEHEALPISTKSKVQMILYNRFKNINLQLLLLKIKMLIKNPLPHLIKRFPLHLTLHIHPKP